VQVLCNLRGLLSRLCLKSILCHDQALQPFLGCDFCAVQPWNTSRRLFSTDFATRVLNKDCNLLWGVSLGWYHALQPRGMCGVIVPAVLWSRRARLCVIFEAWMLEDSCANGGADRGLR
jgi:hypothetical protein